MIFVVTWRMPVSEHCRILDEPFLRGHGKVAEYQTCRSCEICRPLSKPLAEHLMISAVLSLLAHPLYIRPIRAGIAVLECSRKLQRARL